MPPPHTDNQLVQMALLPHPSPSSSSSAPDSPSSSLVLHHSTIMPDRSAFDDDTVHTHPLITRARSKTQPEITFTPLQHQPPPRTAYNYHNTATPDNQQRIHPTNPPAATPAATVAQLTAPHHHNKSKSHHTPATLLRPRNQPNQQHAAATTHKQATHSQQHQASWDGERVLEPHEKKQRMLEYAQYAQSRRQQAAKRAKDKAERAMHAAKGIRESLQANNHNKTNSNNKSGKRKPSNHPTAIRQRETAGGLSLGTQTTSTSISSSSSDMKDIEQRIVSIIRQARVRLQHETNDLEEERY